MRQRQFPSLAGISIRILASASLIVMHAGAQAASAGPAAPAAFPASGTTLNLVNGTHGAYPDSRVYWTLVGMDPANHNRYVHVDCAGTLVPMSAADDAQQTKNGIGYANYSNALSQCKSITIPAISSARLYLTVGSTLYLQAVGNPVTGYTGPNLENPADPNIDVTFNFIEFDTNAANFFGNTTRVDQFGLPLELRLQGQGGYDQTVGETETRAALFQAYRQQVPTPFQGLVQAPYRIVAPAHGSFKPGGANATYLDSYIQSIWNLYSSRTLTFTDAQGTFTGRVVNGQFRFTDGQGTYYVNRMPTTQEVLLGNGPLNDATNAAPGLPTAKQLQIQAQLCAALNRHVAENPALWSSAGSFYASQPTNSYSQFWHAHAINHLSYGFSYDDVGGFSASLVATNPTVATITVGW
ncbi:glycoside hydrolase family 64 protein [Burkholderia glumae]|uniref:glycoside hydrolase family 64 protein n=1 Tax=Burkholderia glumae TaxID=337 RepID=UPI0020374D31|nr:glycoside hydrolase family 64 protein [Burkholderia glumae]MCM2549074.1 glycoside hydrolase family 64 protein [Burkholderia glumae]